MSGTKIINVLRDDRVEDILHIFRTTPANEVIFVLPKKSRAFSNEETFATIAMESQELGKSVLVLSESPEINAIAAKHDFGILKSQDDDDDRSSTSDTWVEPEAEYKEDNNDFEKNEEEELMTEDGYEPKQKYDETEQEEEDTAYSSAPLNQEDSLADEAILTYAAAASPKPPKSMADIVQPKQEDSVSVKINKPRIEKPIDLDVKKDEQIKQDVFKRSPMDELQSVWTKKDTKKEPPPKIVRYPSSNVNLPGVSLGKIASRISKKMMFIYGAIVVVIFGTVLYVSLGKAEIIIKPQARTIDLTQFPMRDVSVSDEYQTVDLENRKIPGQLFSVDKRVEENFPATGEKDVVQKARGKITVYNEYGTAPQVLIATTRFESENGMIFRTLKTITVPGTKVVNGQISPGTIEVEVIADKAGDSYNIPAGKFNLPAFKEKGDTDRYGKFYGQSTEAMKGGIVGKAKVITEQDYVNAKKRVEERVLSEAAKELEAQSSGLRILSMPSPAIKDMAVSGQIDEAVDTFTVTANAQVKAMGFKNADLNELLVRYVQSMEDVQVFPEKLEVSFLDERLNEVQGTLIFSVIAKGKVYSVVNEDKIIMDLMGKDGDYIKDYIKDNKSVQSARVLLSPIWVRKVPNDRAKIQLKMEYD